MNIGDSIKTRRKELNMSVDELAKQLGKNRATVYRYEKGEIENIPSDILEPLAKALKTTPQRLMGWKPKKLARPSLSGNGDWTLGDILKTFRENRKITLEEYSSELNIPIDEIKKYEDGEKQPTASTMNSLMDYLDVDRFAVAQYYLLRPDNGDSPKIAESYISLVRDWYDEFGNHEFSKEDLDQLFQYGRFIKWQKRKET